MRRVLEIAVERGMGAYVAITEQTSGPLLPEMRARLLANDPGALSALASAQAATPSLKGVVLNTAMPCLLFTGEADPFYAGAKEAVNHMPNASFFSLPGLNHVQALTGSDLVLPHVKEFLAEVSKGTTQAQDFLLT